jgi:hypothetical protein
MMCTIIDVTTRTVDKWAAQGEVNISAEVSDLITECVLQCVFGTSSEQLGKLDYVQKGKSNPLYLGQFLKQSFVDHMRRQLKVYR